MAYESALIAGLEAELQTAHGELDRIGIRQEGERLSARVRAAAVEIEDLRRRVALLTHVERTPQLDDENL
jgi:hypothetical protein